jgi:hydroxymethylglutaryl-CoA lyase
VSVTSDIARAPLPTRATVVEVGPRDGFQMEGAFIPTALKIRVVDALSAAGVPVIEVTSFVSAKVIPQLVDAAEVLGSVTRRPGTTYLAMVPNQRGADGALAAGADALKFVISATDAGNLKNVGKTVEQSLDELTRIVALAASHGRLVHAVIGLSFGCPLTGEVAPVRVEAIAARLAASGVTEIAVADSYGFAHPAQVAAVMRQLRAALPAVSFALHLHDTRGLGLANALAGLTAGVTRFEASLGGMGGGPIIPGATGNIATEDLVHMFHGLGVETGIEPDRFADATALIQAHVGRSLPSKVAASGTSAAVFARARAGGLS